MQNKKIELNDLKSGSALSKGRPTSSGKRELHGYDGPLQYLSQGNPDSMTTVQVMPSVKKSTETLNEDLTDNDSKPVAPPRVKSDRPDRLSSATDRTNNARAGHTTARPNTAHGSQIPKSMSMGLTSDEEDEESTPIINDITSPMEEGTPTAPLNITNNAANNMTGGKDKNSNGDTEGEDGGKVSVEVDNLVT